MRIKFKGIFDAIFGLFKKRPKMSIASNKEKKRLDEKLFPELKYQTEQKLPKKKEYNRFIPVQNEITYLQKNEPKKRKDDNLSTK